MHLESCIVLVDFIDQYLRIVVARDQDFKLKGTRFILQAAGPMLRQQWHHQIRASIAWLASSFALAEVGGRPAQGTVMLRCGTKFDCV
jgi:hypothetical protein